MDGPHFQEDCKYLHFPSSTSHRIRLYTTTECGDCRRAKALLKAWHVPYEEINIEETPGAAEFVVQANQGKRSVPAFDVGGAGLPLSTF